MKLWRFIIGLILVSWCSAMAEEPSQSTFKDTQINVLFPSELAGLKYMGIRRYEPAALGYSLRYQSSPTLKADIYVYNSGQMNIPTGWENEIVRKESDSVGKQLDLMVEKGFYHDAKSLESGVQPATGVVRFAWGRYEFIQNDKNPELNVPWLSECFVTGYRGMFVKVRLSYVKRMGEEGRTSASKFVEALATLLEKSVPQ